MELGTPFADLYGMRSTTTPGGHMNQARLEALMRQILDLLRANSDGVTLTEIVRHFTESRTASAEEIRSALHTLMAEDRIEVSSQWHASPVGA